MLGRKNIPKLQPVSHTSQYISAMSIGVGRNSGKRCQRSMCRDLFLCERQLEKCLRAPVPPERLTK